VKNLNIFDVGERFPCVVRRLITCPSNMPLSIGGIRDVMCNYLVDDIFIRIFDCDVHRHDIRGVVTEGFEMSDVSNVPVLCDEVTDYVNIFYISPLDVDYFIGSPPPGTVLVGGPFFLLSSVGTLEIRNLPPSKRLVGMGPCQAPPQL